MKKSPKKSLEISPEMPLAISPEISPTISKTAVGRLVARTFSLEEAARIGSTYEAQGYHPDIVENRQGQMVIYEVWVTMEKQGFNVRKMGTD